MEHSLTRYDIADGITGLYIKTDKFKTARISVSFVTEMDRFSVSAASLLTKLLCRSCQRFPDTLQFQKHLNMLYGASLTGSVVRISDCQLINFGITSISDRFALDGESIGMNAASTLCSAVFRPNISNGIFNEDDFEIERRLSKEAIESRINNKRLWSISRMVENMCNDEPFGIPSGGDIDTLCNISNIDLVDFWHRILTQSPVIICVAGGNDPESVFDLFKSEFSSINRNLVDIKPVFEPKAPQAVREFSDSLDVTQGKLVMGFRCADSSLEKDTVAARMMIDIFGGAPYSKLFTEVREKQSLCYYCAARFYSAKGIVCVDSGVEFENVEKAKQGILAELDIVKKGDFDDELIEASKMGLCDGALAVEDSLWDMESYYLSHFFDAELLSPSKLIEAYKKVTKKQIVDAANSLQLDTVYTLTGKAGDLNE